MSNRFKSSTASIDFSSQYGGKDAFKIVRPHFRALKKASEKLVLKNFPVGELVFILRASGEVQSFSGEGLDLIDFNKKESYLSIDVVVAQESWVDLEMFFEEVLVSSEKFISSLVTEGQFPSYEIDDYRSRIDELRKLYAEEIQNA